MSGPKSGMYSIEDRRRQELQRELERKIENEKAIQIEKMRIKQKESELEALNKSRIENKEKYIGEINSVKAEISHIYENLINYNKVHKIFINENIKKDLEGILYSKQGKKNISLEQELSHMKNILISSKIELRSISEKHENDKDGVKFIKRTDQEKLDFEQLKEVTISEDELDAELKNFGTMEILNDTNISLELKGKNKIIEFGSNLSSHNHKDVIFGRSGTSIGKEQTKMSEDLNEEYTQLDSLIHSYILNTLPPSREELLNLKNSLDSIMNDDRFDNNSKLEQLKIKKEAFLLTKDKYDGEVKYLGDQKERFYNLNGEYKTICNLLNQEAEEFTIDSIDELERKLEEKRHDISKDNETRYISESINEVMEDLGYDIVGSDYMETAKRNIVQNIYDFGNKNVISVYTSDNGSLMFEVNGIKEKEELSASDKLRIKEGMDKFCPQYQKIKDALAEKGISINNENILPADVRFAKAIDLESKNKISGKSKRNSRRKSVNKPKNRML